MIALRTFVAFGFLSWTIGQFAAAAPFEQGANAGEAPSKLVVTCWGAAGWVSGSLHLLDTGNGRWMIDCGTVFAEGPQTDGWERDEAQSGSEARFTPIPVEAAGIDALLLTHAHADHCGRVPLLVNSGFSGPIIATQATFALLGPMLGNAVRFDLHQPRAWIWSDRSRANAQREGRRLTVHWQECGYATKIADRNRATLTATGEKLEEHLAGLVPPLKATFCRMCIKAEVDSIMGRVRTVEYREPIRLAPGVRAGLLDAGHIPGSASVMMEVELGGNRFRILFSGDLGSDLSPVLAGPSPAPNADAVFVEATYGAARRGPEVAGERDRFRRQVGEVVRRNGIAWIPCYALDRTQRILYELHLAQREELLPDTLPIYCASPTAKEITALYRDNRRAGWFRDAVAGDAEAFSPREVLTTIPSHAKLPKPCIVISTSDMVYTAWMQSLLRQLLPEASTAVLLVGYCDPRSAAGRLKAGARELSIDGQATPVAAAVHSFGCFSGHGDATDIDRWLGNIAPSAPIFLVHGAPEELSARADQLRELGRRSVHVPEPGRPIDLIEAIRAGRDVPTPQM